MHLSADACEWPFNAFERDIHRLFRLLRRSNLYPCSFLIRMGMSPEKTSDAYGWSDIPTDDEFLPHYMEEDDGGPVKTIHKDKPWCFSWPDEVRDEVLARLLALNAERAEQERLAGTAPGSKKTAKKRTKKTKAETESGGLF